ncbi:FKBP-type peptidyl-prolyl cis-trans isomerase [Pseudomonas sp. GV071]|uniref:FKBP-type peptidyl-prolyl cis-trans isomerase n=1 Tax=Pseudomonas sp. GV071 TaxID=2135754 RepID=UPI000D33A6F9|nr:FKBP-type peptidyl-prolyl cis-trans isomerase [Pseudomonas sp. GV071]PTQ68800.1 FKBP-type peptidyl-prolyl cis-trans isomerase FklB [Pseudomonas sp. GV071]
MSRCFFLLFFLLATSVHAEENQHDLAYSLGVKLGQRLREEVPDLQLQALLDGLRQAYRGEPLQLDAKRMEQLLADHEAKQAAAPRDDQKAVQAETRFMVNEKAKAGVHELAGGVLYSELLRGQGKKPSANGRVRVKYVGRFADGSVFDESATPTWFKLDSVITGWRIALQEMPVGSKWRLVIPSAQAYGAEGAGDLIAPYSPLVFELELVEAAD